MIRFYLSMTHTQRLNLFGAGCLVAAGGLMALSIPLRCVTRAVEVGGVSFLNGFAFGIALALVTRTRRPLLIYLSLFAAGLTFFPLVTSWPPGGRWNVRLPPGWPDIFTNYFDFLRLFLFLLGFPYPFARFGFHAPDPRPNDAQYQNSTDA